MNTRKMTITYVFISVLFAILVFCFSYEPKQVVIANVKIECACGTPPTVEIQQTTVENPKAKYFELTAYCACEKCCGKSDGITATGTKATAGRTIAVDPKVIPYGSEVIINGHTYIAEDCGGAIKGNRIDIYFDDHNEALAFGKQFATVYII